MVDDTFDFEAVISLLISVVCIGSELLFAKLLYISYTEFTKTSLDCLGNYGEFAREFAHEN
jgi:hypothetical protein